MGGNPNGRAIHSSKGVGEPPFFSGRVGAAGAQRGRLFGSPGREEGGLLYAALAGVGGAAADGLRGSLHGAVCGHGAAAPGALFPVTDGRNEKRLYSAKK